MDHYSGGWFITCLNSGFLLLSFILFLTGVILGARYESVIYFLLCSAVSYALFFLVFVIYVARDSIFFVMDMLPILSLFMIPPGVVLFFVSCCEVSKEQRYLCLFGATMVMGLSFALMLMWISAVQSV